MLGGGVQAGGGKMKELQAKQSVSCGEEGSGGKGGGVADFWGWGWDGVEKTQVLRYLQW